jgi:hypothetical protein
LRSFGLRYFLKVTALLNAYPQPLDHGVAPRQYRCVQLHQFVAKRVIGTRQVPLVLEARMPKTGLMPNAVSRADATIYLVVDRVGSPRNARRQTKVELTGIEAMISNLIAGQFNDPLRVVAFNTLGHWSKDVSRDVAEEIQTRCDIEAMPVPEHIRDFVVSYAGSA